MIVMLSYIIKQVNKFAALIGLLSLGGILYFLLYCYAQNVPQAQSYILLDDVLSHNNITVILPKYNGISFNLKTKDGKELENFSLTIDGKNLQIILKDSFEISQGTAEKRIRFIKTFFSNKESILAASTNDSQSIFLPPAVPLKITVHHTGMNHGYSVALVMNVNFTLKGLSGKKLLVEKDNKIVPFCNLNQ